MTCSTSVLLKVQVVLFDGVDPLDAIGPFEVLHAAGLFTDGAVAVELVGVDGPGDVQTGCAGVVLRATGTLTPSEVDVIVVPGASGRSVSDVDGDEVDPDTAPARLGRTLTTGLPAALQVALGKPDVVLACVCGGSLIPAMAGLIEGRHAVTHHLGMDLLDATGAHAVDARIVDDGDLISGGGVTSGLDVGVPLVERFVGPRVANAVEQLFEFERRGTVWRATGLVPSQP